MLLQMHSPEAPLGPTPSQPQQAHSPCMQHNAHLCRLLLQAGHERLHEDSHGNCPRRGPEVSNALDEPMLDVLQGWGMLGAGDHLQGKTSKVRLWSVSSTVPIRDWCGSTALQGGLNQRRLLLRGAPEAQDPAPHLGCIGRHDEGRWKRGHARRGMHHQGMQQTCECCRCYSLCGRGLAHRPAQTLPAQEEHGCRLRWSSMRKGQHAS